MFCENRDYLRQVKNAAEVEIDWYRFRDKSFFITGASGLIGTFLIDILMYINEIHGLSLRICAFGRNAESARRRFKDYWDTESFNFICNDINKPFSKDIYSDYIIHGASNTHPVAYATDPIGTITTNVIGTQNILEFAVKQVSPRVMFLSSVEIYGENRGDVERFDENYSGHIDCNTLRAGYPESKRVGEALCQAYIHSKDLDVVIPRLSRVYGPTMSKDDSKAIAQFIRNAANKENIVLKSRGDQLYSYTYTADAAMALIYILLYGECGEAYNISDENSEITLKDLAEIIAGIAGTKVKYELPDETEAKGYSNATKALLDNGKLKELGWESSYDVKTGLSDTISILSSMDKEL